MAPTAMFSPFLSSSATSPIGNILRSSFMNFSSSEVIKSLKYSRLSFVIVVIFISTAFPYSLNYLYVADLFMAIIFIGFQVL